MAKLDLVMYEEEFKALQEIIGRLQVDASAKVVTAALRSAMPSPKWDAARKQIEAAFNAALPAGGGYLTYVAFYREAAAGFAAAGK